MINCIFDNKWIVLLFSFLLFFSFLGVVEAGNAYIETATRLISTLTIKDVSANKLIYQGDFCRHKSKKTIPIPNECKDHELLITLTYHGAPKPQSNQVICRMYNGGNMNLKFELDYEQPHTYSYVYGEYTNRNTDGNLLSVYRVTKDQAKAKPYENWITSIIWGSANQILYNPNISFNTSEYHVGEKFQISGQLTEKNPTYNGISYGNNLGGITFDLIVNNGTNNSTYPVTTKSDGSWNYDYTPHNGGQHNIEAHWTGNSTHPLFNQKTTINVLA